MNSKGADIIQIAEFLAFYIAFKWQSSNHFEHICKLTESQLEWFSYFLNSVYFKMKYTILC